MTRRQAPRHAPTLSLALLLVGASVGAACAGGSSQIHTATSAAPHPSAPARASSAWPTPAPRPAGYSKQESSLALSSAGEAPRQRLFRDFSSFRPDAQLRRFAAHSLTQIGDDASKRLTLHARVRMPDLPDSSARRAHLLFELPDAEQRLSTQILDLGFEDRSDAPFLGFARALLPSLLLDPLPRGPVGVGATWQVDLHFEEAVGDVVSRRRYRLVEWRDAKSLGLAQHAPVALLECEWRDAVADGPEQLTTGQLWHSAAWLYPVGHLHQQTRDGQVSLETILVIDNPEWPKLSQIVDPRADVE